MPAPPPLPPGAPRPDLVLRNALVATCDRGPSDAGEIASGAVAVAGGRIAWVGRDEDLDAAARAAPSLDCGGRLVTPGLVDSHTHLVYAGDRADELALRAAGRSYAEIAAAGGGIASTVRRTRAATDGALLEAALARALRLLRGGVTTVEVKSGYGLTVADELRLLRVARALSGALEGRMTVVPTLLAAHAVPPGVDRERWVRDICEELHPAVADEALAVFQDAFVEVGAFTVAEARAVLESGARRGLVPRVHADQLSASGGARLAAALGCASADHLEHLDDDGVDALAAAGVVAGLLPVTTLFLGMTRHAPARRLVERGVRIALATNANPGSSPSESPSLAIGLACAQLGLTPAEALIAFTAGGAAALRRPDLGRVAPGCRADLVVWACRSIAHLPWHLGVNHAVRVLKEGRSVHEAPPGTCAECS